MFLFRWLSGKRSAQEPPVSSTYKEFVQGGLSYMVSSHGNYFVCDIYAITAKGTRPRSLGRIRALYTTSEKGVPPCISVLRLDEPKTPNVRIRSLLIDQAMAFGKRGNTQIPVVVELRKNSNFTASAYREIGFSHVKGANKYMIKKR